MPSWSASLVGHRDAFARIVGRYQALVCSLAYSATGCLGQSEDLAQETFITAWKRLRHLREPAKLRSWLCGIARNRINSALRREGREPLHAAEPLDTIPETPAADALPADHAIKREEDAILWRSLERIPETYREPLVLFYREHQSIERVAEQLELSEDTVKQRLSRGRKLLHEQVCLAFVEGALERTAPGKAFTMGVQPKRAFTLEADGRSLTIKGDFETGTSFRLVVKKDLESALGGRLQNDYEADIVFGNIPPSFAFASASGSYLLRSGARTLELKTVNLDSLVVRVSQIFQNNLYTSSIRAVRKTTSTTKETKDGSIAGKCATRSAPSDGSWTARQCASRAVRTRRPRRPWSCRLICRVISGDFCSWRSRTPRSSGAPHPRSFRSQTLG